MRATFAVLACALALAAGWSCTFPTVTYEEACEVPSPPCNIAKYSDDGDKARADLVTCQDDCTGNPCKDACKVTHDDTIADLQRDCELCSRNNGCSEATADCLKWIGP